MRLRYFVTACTRFSVVTAQGTDRPADPLLEVRCEKAPEVAAIAIPRPRGKGYRGQGIGL